MNVKFTLFPLKYLSNMESDYSQKPSHDIYDFLRIKLVLSVIGLFSNFAGKFATVRPTIFKMATGRVCSDSQRFLDYFPKIILFGDSLTQVRCYFHS